MFLFLLVDFIYFDNKFGSVGSVDSETWIQRNSNISLIITPHLLKRTKRSSELPGMTPIMSTEIQYAMYPPFLFFFMTHMHSMAGALSPRVGIVDFLKLFATYRLLVLRVNYLSLTKIVKKISNFHRKKAHPIHLSRGRV